MKILAIDTSCDETAAAVTDGTQVLSNVVWSQASLYAEFGGVMPTVAQRQHQERIDWVVDQAIKKSGLKIDDIDSLAVTTGPGLSIALSVGINKAKEIATKYKRPLIAVNHIEAHLFSPLASSKSKTIDIELKYPTLGLVLSGGTTILCLVKGIGEYKILAKTQDDALGEALDKAARLLGFGYPGGAILEKFARLGNPNKYSLPIPLIEDKEKNRFSYSGIKSAMVRLFNSIKNPTRQDLYDLAYTFQDVAFKHVEKVLKYHLETMEDKPKILLFGGGVANNIEIKKRLRKICYKYNIKMLTPYNKRLNGDNAAMIGVMANLKPNYMEIEKIDYNPRLSI